ncbi:MAG: hypothetical protein GY940_03000 [bacterium]|nr:hypothetical protein [bacterium]
MRDKKGLCTGVIIPVLMILMMPPLQAQFNGPNPLKNLGLGVPYWRHVLGDTAQLPCLHMVKKHAGGHSTRVACAHFKKKHSKGDYTGVTAPCLHIKNGVKQHSGHKVYKPCTHLSKKHPNGHAGPNIPCAHVTKKHPRGHTGPNVPCKHFLKVKARDNVLGLVFYTSDSAFRASVKAAVRRLRSLGVKVGSPRNLHVFHRPPFNGKVSSKDPLWSHYNPGFHSIQVMRGITNYHETLRHELGHAILGHSCIQILSLGGSHKLTKRSKPGVAMSEGWANFVGLALTHNRSTGNPVFKSHNWETGTKEDGGAAGAKSPNIEFRVGCALWDIYDGRKSDDDRVSVPFREMFRVYSPSFKTLRNGPVIPDLDSWLNRFKNNNPSLRKRVDKIKQQNTKSRS